jgi:hypothetical protein
MKTGTPDAVGAQLNSAWLNATGSDPTWASGWSIIGAKTVCVLSGSWQKFSVTVTRPGTNAVNLAFVVWADAVLNGTGGINVGTPNDGWAWKEVQFVIGSSAPAWGKPDMRTEQIKAERFYWKTYNIDTPVFSASQPGTLGCTVAGATYHQFSITFPRMRVPPAVTLINYAGSAGSWTDSTMGTTTPGSAGFISETNAFLQFNSTTDGHVLQGHVICDARL